MFDGIVTDFLISVNPGTMALTVATGFMFGIAMGRSMPGYATATYLFWLLAAGMVFFLPLTVLRASQGADTWARLFGTGFLWGIFIIAKFVGATFTEGRRR